MTPTAWTIIAGLGLLAGLPSIAIAGRGQQPWWRRLAAAAVVPAAFVVLMLLMPSYPPGRNTDDWRRGCFASFAVITAGGSAVVQAALAIEHLLRTRRH